MNPKYNIKVLFINVAGLFFFPAIECCTLHDLKVNLKFNNQ